MKTRYRKIKERGYYRFNIVYQKDLTPETVWDIERYFKSKMLKYKYQPKNDFGGSTECFSMDLPLQDIIAEVENWYLK